MPRQQNPKPKGPAQNRGVIEEKSMTSQRWLDVHDMMLQTIACHKWWGPWGDGGPL